ncbi:MAG: rhodanese-like domain-containing protein [Verrucomicrobiota bacterium]
MFEIRGRIKNRIRPAVLILLVALIPSLGAALWHPKRPSWSRPVAGNEIDLSTAVQWGARVLWVDARPRVEFDRGHIPGAVLLNEDEWDRLLDGFLDAWKRDAFVVVYCSSVSCDASHEVAARLKSEARIENIYVLKGGWETWQAQKK